MKCLIIGGGGFVGSWLTHELISRKQEVVIIDPFIYYSNWDEKTKRLIYKFKKENLLNKAKIYRKKFEEIGEKIIKKEKPDAVVHLGGIPLEKADDFEISLKQLTDDVGLIYQIVKSVKENSIKKFVFMSSIASYGDCKDVVFENHQLVPKTPYGIMKAAGDFITQSELDNWNIVRTTSIYGFGDMNSRATNIVINKALKKEKFWINSELFTDFIYVKDLVAGIADVILKAPPKEIFHISGGKAIALADFVKQLNKYFKLDYEVKTIHDRPKRGTMNNAKAKKILGWYPKKNIESGLLDYMKYVKKYKVA